MTQCFECVYFDAFHHRCAKRRRITFGPCLACDKFRDVDADPAEEVVFRD